MKKIINLFIPLLLVIIVYIIGVAYSALDWNLAINDLSSSVRITKDIRITGISISDSSNGVVSVEDYNTNNISSSLNLPSSDSYVTYKIDVTNIGNIQMGILNITGLPSNLEYTPSLDEIKQEKVCDTNNNCTLGITKEYNITIRYKNGGYNAGSTNYDFTLDFEFAQAYDVTMNGQDDNVTYSKVALSGDTYQADVGTGLSKDAFTISMANQPVSNFTYENGILSIPNVDGNINISIFDIKDIEFVLPADGKPVSAPVSAPTLNDFITLSFDAYNSSPSIINYVKVEIVYSFSSGGTNQAINIELSTKQNGQTVSLGTQTLPFNTKGNNVHKYVEFSGLNIPSNSAFTIKPVSNNINNGKPVVSEMIITVGYA